MKRLFIIALPALLLLTTQADAFCGDFELGTAPGFGSDSWGQKFTILGAILAAVLTMPTLAAYAIVKSRKTEAADDLDISEMETV